MLRFIDLTLSTCHIHYTFLSLCKFGTRGNLKQNTRALEVRHFCSNSGSINKNIVGTFSGLGRYYSTSGLVLIAAAAVAVALGEF